MSNIWNNADFARNIIIISDPPLCTLTMHDPSGRICLAPSTGTVYLPTHVPFFPPQAEAHNVVSTLASASEGYPFVPPSWAPSVFVPLTGLILPAVAMASLFVYIEVCACLCVGKVWEEVAIGVVYPIGILLQEVVFPC